MNIQLNSEKKGKGRMAIKGSDFDNKVKGYRGTMIARYKTLRWILKKLLPH